MKLHGPVIRVAVLALGVLLGASGSVFAAEPVEAGKEVVRDAPPDDDDYVIGPGDSLNVLVIDNANLSVQGVAVRPDGKITTPLVEDMVAVGKSPSQLARDMESVLAKFLRTPQVSVIVAGAVSAYSQVQVVGQVRQPRALPYRKGLRVLDVVLAADGLTDFAAPNRARIVREVDGKTVETRVRLGDLLNDGDLRQNHELKPGDILIVPQSFF